jgi:hypothetical protein
MDVLDDDMADYLNEKEGSVERSSYPAGLSQVK